MPKNTAEFFAFLGARRRIPSSVSWHWRGHAYLLYGSRSRRRLIDEGIALVGDAAGLAYAQSGEGIRPAIESGLLAAATLIEARGRYTRDRLAPYEHRLRARLGGVGVGPFGRALSWMVPSSLRAPLAGRLLQTPSFVRHVVLDRWFLRAHEPPLALS